MVIIFIILLIIAIILAIKYPTQLIDGFIKILNFIFGDSPNNVIKDFIKQITDNFINNLFKETG